jgi:hypothetical protein
MPTLLKAKPKTAVSHNKAIAAIVEKVQSEDEVPFQVRLPMGLAKRVKLYSAENGESHKTIVTKALEAYLSK